MKNTRKEVMKTKQIKKRINKKLKSFADSFFSTCTKTHTTFMQNAFVSGGAISSLLLNEKVNDYDIYLRTKTACEEVAQFAINYLNQKHRKSYTLNISDERIKLVINSSVDKFNSGDVSAISPNAISFKDDIQIITRFFGEPAEVHKNYDFVHCTNYYSLWNNSLELNDRALVSLLEKDLKYVGSKYPVCSIMRLRKYLSRGFTISAGEIVKICYQISEIDLNDLSVLEDQLIGVDVSYFSEVIDDIKEIRDKGMLSDDEVRNLIKTKLFDMIDSVFNR